MIDLEFIAATEDGLRLFRELYPLEADDHDATAYFCAGYVAAAMGVKPQPFEAKHRAVSA